MNVSATGAGFASLRSSASAPPATTVRSDRTGSIGPLLDSDMAVIAAATGIEFNWPPADGARVPEAAFELSAARARQMAANLPMKDLTARDLSVLHSKHLLDDNMLAKGLDYLKDGTQAKGVSSAINPPARPSAQAAPGTIAADGSIYI